MSHVILLIQSDAAMARVALDALRKTDDFDFDTEWLRLASQGVSRLTRNTDVQREPIAAIVAALSLSDSCGLATFEGLLQVAPHVPILLLSTSEDEQIARLAIQRGAQDYLLTESMSSYQLPKAVRSMVERATISEALYREKERAEITLNSIGDAVISTDRLGNVTYLNLVATRLTGWENATAIGMPLDRVFNIIEATTREVAQNPMALAMQENRTVALAPNCLLIRRDGVESAIEDSTAPIHSRNGEVVGAVMVFHDVSEARSLALRMSYLAQHDSLTDLPNRIMLGDRLHQAMMLADRQAGRVAVLYMDLDRFKHTNDTLGHAVGDALLKVVAQRLQRAVRSTDTVSRQGGDEFVVLLPQITGVQHAEMITRKILLALRESCTVDEHDLHITASIGIAIYPDDGMDVDTLLKHADFAMYQAKDSGRDNCQFYCSELNVQAVERHAVEAGLRLALQNAEFVLHYQPRISLQTGLMVGVEALIRWHRPGMGLFSPGDFIAVAEDSGLIGPIGRWVLHEACRQAAVWLGAGLPPLRMSVNISAVELRARDFVSSVRSVLLQTGLRPEMLELELTETFLMQDDKVTDATLRALKELGVKMALDDFGTGYSSLSYAKRLPITCLKIDRSFVSNLDGEDDADDASIVRAVINMGKSLHMCVVAEGVETQIQLDYLKEQGCPEAQGYYFSRPVEQGEIERMLRRTMAGVPLRQQAV
jgi:diguanylate cyclase (GGDEF)-like protein/PAS domain S-box-containing protein